MWMFVLWNIAAFIAAIYCLTKAVIDFRARRFVMAAVGFISAVVFLLTPVKVPTQAVKIDLPASTG